jgi:methylmalonyl-CoA/ethylmalonyl-CoA epimerase
VGAGVVLGDDRHAHRDQYADRGLGCGPRMPARRIESVDQVAVVVHDLDEAMRHYTTALGIAPWRVYTLSPDWVPNMTYRGREQPYSARMALADVGAMQYELIQPLDGPTIHREFLDARGEGLHHFGYFVDDLDAAIAEMAAQGFSVLQSGRRYGVDGDGGYAYFDTDAALACVVEAIELPRALRAPERTYPPAP